MSNQRDLLPQPRQDGYVLNLFQLVKGNFFLDHRPLSRVRILHDIRNDNSSNELCTRSRYWAHQCL